MNSLNVR